MHDSILLSVYLLFQNSKVACKEVKLYENLKSNFTNSNVFCAIRWSLNKNLEVFNISVSVIIGDFTHFIEICIQ